MSTTRPIAGSSFYVLLALVDCERYGLGIVQEVERRTGGAIRLGPGTLYNTIKKLVADALIDEVPADESSPGEDTRRRYYRITEAGRGIVQAEAARLEQLVDVARDKHLLRARPDA